MRRAEIVMAAVMAVFSVYLMWKSTELPIGWLKGEGPGGGAWPFWLAAIMLGSCVVIIYNWYRRKSPPSRSEDVYMTPQALRSFLLVGGSLTVTIGLVHFIGVYGAVFLFLIFYIRFLGNHSWLTTASIAVATPVVTFFFFDVALRIVLPKGYTEPLFIPLYNIFL